MNGLSEAAGMLKEEGVRGAQSVRRALALLRLVGKSGEAGVKLAQVVRESGLDRATAYRLLCCLVEEQFVDRDETQHYRLGPQAVLLGSLMPSPAPLLSRFVPAMKRIARIAGDTVFLMMRHGDGVVCEHREVGGALVKILTTDVGQRRLLGTGTGGVAVLGLMTDGELSQTWQRHRAEYQERGVGEERLLAMARAVRARGLAITFDSFEVGVAGIGLAFRMGEHAMGAVSVATLTARFGPERQHELGELLSAELRAMGLLLDEASGRAGRT